MIQDNCMDIVKDFYTSFENCANGVNFFFNSKIKEIKAMLNDSLNKKEKDFQKKIKELEETVKHQNVEILRLKATANIQINERKKTNKEILGLKEISKKQNEKY